MKKLSLAQIQAEEEKRRLLEVEQAQLIAQQQAAEQAKNATQAVGPWSAASKPPATPTKLSLREIQEQV